jgi:adenosylmethionine-8-amino-7-oxononanoate aminotransferase
MASDPTAAAASIDAAARSFLGRCQPSPTVPPPPRPGSICDTICQRLQRKFGLGDEPRKRMALYRQLEALARIHEEAILALISEAVCGAAQARYPDRYFCRAIRLKIAAAGLRLESDEAVSW